MKSAIKKKIDSVFLGVFQVKTKVTKYCESKTEAADSIVFVNKACQQVSVIGCYVGMFIDGKSILRLNTFQINYQNIVVFSTESDKLFHRNHLFNYYKNFKKPIIQHGCDIIPS